MNIADIYLRVPTLSNVLICDNFLIEMHQYEGQG